jgi:hypothetical protein
MRIMEIRFLKAIRVIREIRGQKKQVSLWSLVI